MIAAVGRRFAQAVPVLLGVLALTFVMVNVLPGDVATSILGENATPEATAALQEKLGLDQSLLQRFGDYLSGLAQGDLGTSLRTGEAVFPRIVDGLVVSVELMVLAQILALGAAVSAALVAVRFRGSWVERLISTLASAAISVPGFLLALVLILVFAVELQAFPAVGFTPLSEGLVPNLKSLVLPAAALATAEFAIYYRVLHAEMTTIVREPFVEAARSKGIGALRLHVRHVLRNALFPLVTVVGLNVGRLLGGALVIESVFALPGVGRLMIDAIAQRDLPLIQGVVLFVASAYVLVNLAVDLLYSVLDPRVRDGALS